MRKEMVAKDGLVREGEKEWKEKRKKVNSLRGDGEGR